MQRIAILRLAMSAAAFFHGCLARAEISAERHVHHFYNARLLQAKEWQVSIAGNFKMGLTDDYEVGASGLGLLAGMLNVSAKHRMFYGNDWTTAFSTHIFMLERGGPGSSDSDDANSGESVAQSRLFVIPSAVLTTTKLTDQGYLNWGLIDYFIYQSVSSFDTKVSMHLLSPALGFDQYLSKHWAFGVNLSYGAYLIGSVESEVADIDITANLLGGVPAAQNPSISFATFTYSLINFNIEFGAMIVQQNPYPYANAFWRVN